MQDQTVGKAKTANEAKRGLKVAVGETQMERDAAIVERKKQSNKLKKRELVEAAVIAMLAEELMTMTGMLMAQEERENLQEGPQPGLLLPAQGAELVA
ncbi:hypothetical protein ACLOJK_005623 [Asimina triloba]